MAMSSGAVYVCACARTQRLTMQNDHCKQHVFNMIIHSPLKIFLCVFLQEAEIAPDCNHVSIPSKTVMHTEHFLIQKGARDKKN